MTTPRAGSFIRYRRSRFATRLPAGHRYTRSHYWLKQDDAGHWRVGLTTFATRMLGDLVECMFAVEPGESVGLGQTIGSIEGFKAISDVYAVASGRFVGANEALDTLPEDEDIILFVSVHANTVAFRTEPVGFEVWVLPKEHERTVLPSGSTPSGDSAAQPIFNAMLDEQINRESVVLANEILDGLEAHVGDRSPNRGLREEKWAVVRRARMPAVLVEVGYMSNPVEARRMLQPAYLNDLARGIYDGIRGFIEWFEATPEPAQ